MSECYIRDQLIELLKSDSGVRAAVLALVRDDARRGELRLIAADERRRERLRESFDQEPPGRSS